MMPTRQEIYEHEMRWRSINHGIDFIRELLAMLDELTPGSPMEAGLIAAIAATESTLATLGVKVEF